MLIRNFNNKHTSGSQRITTTAIAAQVQINAKSNKNTTDNVISLIKQVLKFPDYYIINWKNGGSLILYFNGGYEKYNCNGKFANGGGVGSQNGTGFHENGHILLFTDDGEVALDDITAAIDINMNIVCDENVCQRVDENKTKSTIDKVKHSLRCAYQLVESLD